MEDTALARAAIGARTDAARTMGGARIANATDNRSIGNDIAQGRFSITGRDATERRGIGDQLATGRFNLADAISQGRLGVENTKIGEIQGAENWGTGARGTLFDQNFTRANNAATNLTNLNKGRLDLLGIPGRIGNEGFNRSLNMLNWIVPGSTPPPTSTASTFTAGTSGANTAAAGAGLAGAGLSVFNSILNKPAPTTTPGILPTPTAASSTPLNTPPPPTPANTNRYLTPGLT